MRVVPIVSPVFLLSGCLGFLGGGNDDDDTEDKPDPIQEDPETGDTGAPPTTTPPEPEPATVEVEPATGFVNVAPLLEPKLTFSRDVDAESLAKADLTITTERGRALTAELRTAEPTAVVIAPDAPLPFGQPVSFAIGGLRMRDGTDAPSLSFAYTVHASPPIVQGVYGTDGIAQQFSYDTQGRRVQWRQFTLGPDGGFPTADDEQVLLRVDTYDPVTGRQNGAELFDDPGIDQAWGTADDLPMRIFSYTTDGNEDILKNIVLGPDRLPFTADDEIAERNRYLYDANNDALQITISQGAGDDGVWYTNDDVGFQFVEYDRNPDGTIDLARFYNDVGADGLTFTADDGLFEHQESDYDGYGLRTARRAYTGPGIDGAWLTADDTLFLHERFVYDPLGILTWSHRYTDAGADATWFTADDVGSAFQTTLDGERLDSLGIDYSGFGVDGSWGTSDDVVVSWCDYAADGGGFYRGEVCFFGQGDNGTWFDGDDDRWYQILYANPQAPQPGKETSVALRDVSPAQTDPAGGRGQRRAEPIDRLPAIER